MKRKFAFFLLFSALFTFSAAAEEVNYAQFGDAQEASREGYRSGMYDKYEQYSNELSKPDSDLRIQLIEFFCENFESGMDPEEYDREMIKQSYDWGYDFGVRDYILIEHTLDRSQETLYNWGYEDGAYDKYDEIMNDPDFTSPTASDYTSSEKNTGSSSASVFDYLIVLLCIIGIAYLIYVLQQLTSRWDETRHSAISAFLAYVFVFAAYCTVLPFVILGLSTMFHRWADERVKRYAAQDEALLRLHFDMYREGTYMPQLWEIEEFEKRDWRKY